MHRSSLWHRYTRCALWLVGAALLVLLWLALPGSRLRAEQVSPPPPIPSSFYGTVLVNGQNVPNATTISVGNDGVIYWRTRVFMSDGVSRYRMNVPGDRSETYAHDGGTSGEVLEFVIGGLPAQQTGAWQSGGNELLNLTATGALPTPTPMPQMYLPLLIK